MWRLRSVSAAVSLRAAIDRMDRRGALPTERPLTRGASLPPDIDEHGSGGDVPDYLLPALLRPAEKRALDLLYDWPWLARSDLAGLLGVSPPASVPAHRRPGGLRAGRPRPRLGSQADPHRPGGWRCWPAGTAWPWAGPGSGGAQLPLDAGDWRNVSGRRSRQLLRNIEHTAAVHGFIAALATQARDQGWEIDQLDPPIRASRYFRHFGGRRSVHPDAFGILRQGAAAWPFSWSGSDGPCDPSRWRSASLPTCATTPPTGPPTTTAHGPPSSWSFHEDLAATHFLRVALEEMVRTRTPLPLLVSHRGLLEREGPLGRAWLAPGEGFEPVRPINNDQTGEPRT